MASIELRVRPRPGDASHSHCRVGRLDADHDLTCQDAIQAIFNSVSGKNAKRLWVLDADLAGEFDHLDHDHLLTSLGTFPGRGLIAQWLKAGVVEKGRLTPTGEGSPQGGVISPLMMNVALHGMETAAGVRYRTTGLNAGATIPGYPTLIRYADDRAPRTQLEVAM